MTDESQKWAFPTEVTQDFVNGAKISPPCIVENYLFEDVGLLIAPGGTGKTTIVLHECVHIALGLPLWGLEVLKPGKVLIFSAEDSAEMMWGRLRKIMDAMDLTPEQRQMAISNIRISDVTGEFKKLTIDAGGQITPHPWVKEIVEASVDRDVRLVVFDPAVSFGVGESKANDAEQGLIEAARTIMRGVRAMVRYLHHTGKAAARTKDEGQYAGRGGSAFADGSRMVNVLVPLEPNEWQQQTGQSPAAGEQYLKLTRSKLTYAPPQPDIFIKRDGYSIQHVQARGTSAAAETEAIANQLWQFLNDQQRQEKYHSGKDLDDCKEVLGLSRNCVRRGISSLKVNGRVHEELRPNGAKGKYLKAVTPAVPATPTQPQQPKEL